MGPSSVGAVVLVPFPFSDLSAYKLRPAVVLADSDHGDWVLCQVTSDAYFDAVAVKIESADFASGSLQTTSYARPGKLFTANEGLMKREVGVLSSTALRRVLDAVVELLDPPTPK
jgi:mRNA interferase MazF